ncbi:MAG: SpoIVB peptidase S55 domain-containing protein, partial [Acidobacteriota bacterium]
MLLSRLVVTVIAWTALIMSAPAATRVMPIDEVKPGMDGIGLTVFQGTTIEEFKVHVLGVLRATVGPRRDLILARLEGGPLAKTGVIAGMSGSPVYIDGRLVGAVSHSLGSFSTEAIAG